MADLLHCWPGSIGTCPASGITFWKRLSSRFDHKFSEREKPPRSASETASVSLSWQAFGKLKNTLTDAELRDFRACYVSSRAYTSHSPARLIADLIFGEGCE
jgi:hypothetical protein